MLAYEGLRPGEAFALQWRDIVDDRGRARPRLLVQRAVSGEQLSTTKSQRAREPELFAPVAKELIELYLAAGRPDPFALVFPDSEGGYLRRQNWRRRVWIPALERAGLAYFRTYDLRHTCATLLLYEGRTVNEVADHLGHADPGFTARTYAHVMRDASNGAASRSRARSPRARRPLVDPSTPETGTSTHADPSEKIPANRGSRRADSNRGPLHYECRPKRAASPPPVPPGPVDKPKSGTPEDCEEPGTT